MNPTIIYLFGIVFLDMLSLVVANSTCPDNEGLFSPITHKGLLYLEGADSQVSLVVPRSCECYNIYYVKHPMVEPYHELINSGQDGITINKESPNCTLIIAKPQTFHAGVYVFQRRNYKEIKNGRLVPSLLQWDYDVLILGNARCGIVSNNKQMDKEISDYAFCNSSLISNQTRLNITIVLNVNSEVVVNEAFEISDFVGHAVVLRRNESFTCKVGLKGPEHYSNLAEELKTVCRLPPSLSMKPTIPDCQPSGSLNILTLIFGALFFAAVLIIIGLIICFIKHTRQVV